VQVDIHADDLGLYDTDLSGLDELHKSGYLQGVSIVATGSAFEPAREFLCQNPQLKCAVHLNLVEGTALSNPGSVPLLVDARGRFRHGFLSLWLLHMRETGQRAELARQIGREMATQISMVRARCNLQSVAVDSHRYAHLLPFVWPVLVKNAAEMGISAIRIVNEPVVLRQRMGTLLANFSSLNPVKQLLLNHLSGRVAPILQENALSNADYSVGVSASGRMDADTVRRALERVRRTSPMANPRVEVVFHPLRAIPASPDDDAISEAQWRFYSSDRRAAEMEVLRSPELQHVVTAYRGQPLPDQFREIEQ